MNVPIRYKHPQEQMEYTLSEYQNVTYPDTGTGLQAIMDLTKACEVINALLDDAAAVNPKVLMKTKIFMERMGPWEE